MMIVSVFFYFFNYYYILLLLLRNMTLVNKQKKNGSYRVFFNVYATKIFFIFFLFYSYPIFYFYFFQWKSPFALLLHIPSDRLPIYLLPHSLLFLHHPPTVCMCVVCWIPHRLISRITRISRPEAFFLGAVFFFQIYLH